MKSGTCPKYGEKNVHDGSGVTFKPGPYGSNSIPIGFFSRAPLDNYVCIDCGYVESYVGDRAKRRTIAGKWPRVRPAEEE